jgi:hypothetical protein
MPSGHRSLAFTTLIAALALAFGLGIYVSGLNYPDEGYQSYQASQGDKQGAAASIANVATAIVERTPCDQPQSETESGLCAQWRAAKAAEKSAEWTVYGFWATLAGMALLTSQLILTREAVKDTGDATKAMRDSNDIMRTLEDARIVVSITDTKNEPKVGFFYTVEFSNIGRSAAIIHSVCIDDDLVNIESEIAAGEKFKLDDVCFTRWEFDPFCLECFNGELPEDILMVVDQTTPLRGRFKVEIPCRFCITTDGLKAMVWRLDTTQR